MNSLALFCKRVVSKSSYIFVMSRKLSGSSFDGERDDNGFHFVVEPLEEMSLDSSFYSKAEECGNGDDDEIPIKSRFSLRENFYRSTRGDARQVLDILEQDGPGFDAKSALNELGVRVSGLLVRKVLKGILGNVNYANKTRCAKLGFKFFVWSGQQESYRHTTNSYHLLMKIFSECEEYKAMWRLVDEMTENGFSITAQTFIILICTCGEAGVARGVVEKFIKSKTFNYRPFRHSFNAILHGLLSIHQYKLIEWVYELMLDEGLSPDILSYNILMCAKYRLGKLDQFHRLLDDMGKNGFSPDFHTYNILLHVLGKGNKPLAALNLLNHMKEVGINPSILHFTTLIDGLSRAGNLDACRHFFDETVKNGCIPDVPCYTVIITGHVMAGELETAEHLFNEMVTKGRLPNVYTYHSMIRGYCRAGKFKEACSILKLMESRGCNPNFVVYSTLVSNLQNAGRLADAHEVIRHMVDKGQYTHLVTKTRGYKRC